jgi:hypothetical protein
LCIDHWKFRITQSYHSGDRLTNDSQWITIESILCATISAMPKYPTLSLDALLEQDTPATRSKAGSELITHAYQVADAAHEGQKRTSGEPYVQHCLERQTHASLLSLHHIE